MFCTSCGTENPEAAKFCFKCGAPTVTDKPPTGPSPTAPSPSVDSGAPVPSEEPAPPKPAPPLPPRQARPLTEGLKLVGGLLIVGFVLLLVVIIGLNGLTFILKVIKDAIDNPSTVGTVVAVILILFAIGVVLSLSSWLLRMLREGMRPPGRR